MYKFSKLGGCGSKIKPAMTILVLKYKYNGRGLNEHSVEEVLERPTGYPKVGGSNHGSGDFSLQPQRNPYLS